MLKINMEYRKGILFIRLKGELTKYTYKSLNDYLIPVIKNQGIRYIVYNLQNINLLDNYGKEGIKRGILAVKKNEGDGLVCNTKNSILRGIKTVDNELSALQYLKV